MSIKRYSEVCKLETFEDRFNYLKLDGNVGEDTFGFDRYLNQLFYRSREWKALRDQIIIRDNGCDLGVPGFELGKRIIIHHINPLTKDDIRNQSEYLLDPEFLICTSHNTHNALHYGSDILLPAAPIERTRNDTCPWRK